MAIHIHLLHNSLSSFHSHPYGESLAYLEAFEVLGVEASIYSNKACAPEIIKHLNARPIFLYATDSMVDTNPISAEQSEFTQLAHHFGSALDAHLPKEFSSSDIIYVPYARQNEAHGIALWLRSIPTDKRPKIVLFCYRPEFRWSLNHERTRFEGNFTYWRAVGKELIDLVGRQNILLATTDDRLSATLHTASGLPALTVKMPTLYPLDPSELETQARDIDISILGTFRPERGSQLLVDILRLVDLSSPGLKYLVQVQDASDFENLKKILSGHQFQGNLEVVIGHPDQKQYIRQMARCKLACLPYAPARYATRSSGVLSECAAYGIPMIIPSNTWLSDRLDAGEVSALTFEVWTPESIANSILSGIKDIDSLSLKAKRLAPNWFDKNNAKQVIEDIFAALHLKSK